MKKVCFITSNLLPVPDVKGGAIETIMTNVIIEQEQRRQLDITVVSIYDKKAFLESKKFTQTKFIYVRKNLKYIICSLLFKISNKIFKTNFNTYNYCVLNKIKKIPFDYVVAEGGHYESYKSFLKYFEKEQLVLHLHHKGESNEIIDSSFSKLIGVSDFVINDFKKTSSIKNYYLLKNSISISRFDKKLETDDRIKLMNALGLKKDDFIIIYCGRLVKGKGILELIKAVKLIDNSKIKLVVVGAINSANGGRDAYTDKLNEETKDNDRIILTGYIANDDLYKYYKLADIMVIPSLCEEAAGLVCIEGMVCKKPIITTDAGGISEYVSNSTVVVKRNDKFVINLKNAILNLYKKQDEFLEIGENNFRCALKFNNQNYYSNLVKIIENDFDSEKK